MNSFSTTPQRTATIMLVGIVSLLTSCSPEPSEDDSGGEPYAASTPSQLVDESQPEVLNGVSVAEEPWWQQARPSEPTASTPPPIDTTFTLSGDVLFEVGSTELTSGAASQLGAILNIWLKHPGARIAIGGHTDSDGTEVDNQTLSEGRAGEVIAWFVARGVPERDTQAAGYGETRPVAPNDTAANRALNRRCDITVTSR